VARLIGPDEAVRAVYVTSGSDKGKYAAQGMTVPLYADQGLTTGADVLTVGGSPISGSPPTLTVDAYSRIPLFQFPDGVDTVWTSIGGGPAVPLYARTDDRIDGLLTRIAALEAAAGQNNTLASISGNYLTVGEETFNRVTRTDTNSLTSQAMQLNYFTARKSETTTQVRVISGGVATGTPTLVRYGLYAIDGAGAGTLVAATSSDTSQLAATNTTYTKAWTTPYAKVAGQRYAVAVLTVASTAGSLTGIATSGFSAELAVAPRITGRLNSQTDLPSTFTDASLVTAFFHFYAAVLP